MPQKLPARPQTSTSYEGSCRRRLVPLTDLYEYCIGCGRCEEACPVKLNIHSFIVKAGEKFMIEETNLCRAGRGAVQDVEIRNVGSPIVLGEIPGILAVVGCSNYPKGGKDVYDICREFASQTLHRCNIRMLSYVRGQLQERRGQNTVRGIPRRIRSWRSPQRRFMRRKQPHRRRSNQSRKHLRQTQL